MLEKWKKKMREIGGRLLGFKRQRRGKKIWQKSLEVSGLGCRNEEAEQKQGRGRTETGRGERRGEEKWAEKSRDFE